ncbi:uncharacterized protein PADG_05294 [Paracoccidioides brasiliensis Pb18]|uniref:Uncharacterized protein n=1 Tax=Paracoccidioides brasiliensis (strain Pb18) TaxID=502780 RepID=C1GDF8_PARBD|nr:uncharacterized protein PADG_05294 [Paracoccidioides brasiliensis Pb18]EEH49215.2 hypothetical protein PADG_05294 [Paracoccidioides brasiliensis Pb18]
MPTPRPPWFEPCASPKVACQARLAVLGNQQQRAAVAFGERRSKAPSRTLHRLPSENLRRQALRLAFKTPAWLGLHSPFARRTPRTVALRSAASFCGFLFLLPSKTPSIDRITSATFESDPSIPSEVSLYSHLERRA